jgi:hypothetical protein
MHLWTDFLDWLSSNDGRIIVRDAVIPFLAIIIAGIIAAGIGRSSARRVIELSDREVKASAVTALISAARKAAVWNTLPVPEQQHVDHLIGDADIRLRLLPVAGTALAADWARHEIADMKRNAVSFSFQAEQTLIVFRDRLIEWQARPSRAKRLFKNDLDAWAYDSSLSEQELVHQQQQWAAAQVTKTGAIDVVATPSPAPAAPAPTASATPAPAPTTSAAPPAAVAAPAAPTAPSWKSTPEPVAEKTPDAAVAEPAASAPSAFAGTRFTRPAPVTPIDTEPEDEPGDSVPELVEPAAPTRTIDTADDQTDNDTPAFIEPATDDSDRTDSPEALPEIVIDDEANGVDSDVDSHVHSDTDDNSNDSDGSHDDEHRNNS